MRRALRFHLIPALLLLLSTGTDSVAAQDVLIRGATVYTMAGQGVMEGGDVLIRDGKIAEVGTSISAPRVACVKAMVISHIRSSPRL